MTDEQTDIVDLQTQLAFQEDLLGQLNDVVTKQGMIIADLETRVKVYEKTLKDLRDEVKQLSRPDQADEKPPHY